jgi:fumarate hydratase, class I
VVDVKIMSYPTHAASLPVGMIPNCAATRHVEFHLDGSGPAVLTPPRLEDWPDVTWQVSESAKRVDLDRLTPAQVQSWQPGDRLLLNGKLLTGRDAAHKRIQELLESGQGLPEGVDFTNRLIYYVGPVDPVRDEAVGPAGPTTATRMDKFTEMMLAQTGLIGMVGKAERGPVAIESIKRHKAAYLMAVGGRRLPGVAGDPQGPRGRLRGPGHGGDLRVRGGRHAGHRGGRQQGESVHQTGPAEWRVKIAALKKAAG